MDRSNSVSSTASSSSTKRSSTVEPFNYQRQLLERTSSLSRSNSSLLRNNVLASQPTPSGNRRWTPTHRVGSSVDSVRGKFEELARAESSFATRSPSSPTKSSYTKEKDLPTAPSSPVRSDSDTELKPTSSRSSQSFNAARSAFAGENDSFRSSPTAFKRRTLPEPIIASPLSPNTTGVSVTSPEASFSSAVSTSRIHFPIPRGPSSPSVSSVRQMYDRLPNAPDFSSTRSRRTVDFDSIMKETGTTVIRQSSPVRQTSPVRESMLSRESILEEPETTPPRRPRTTSLFDTPTRKRESAPELISRQFSIPAEPQKPERPSIPNFSPSTSFPSPYKSPPSGVSTETKRFSASSSNLARNPAVSKKSYGDNIVVGRRLGRHLPRIASGDGPDIEDQHDGSAKSLERSAESKAVERKQAVEDKELARLSRLERREKRLRTWQMELEKENERPPPLPPKDRGQTVDSRFDKALTPVQQSISHADDVAGVPGRLRLSKDVATPSSPLMASFGNSSSKTTMPTPSAKIRGLWADTQRHLLRAYEYLCHVGEAQQWIEGCLGEELGFGVVEMDDGLRNGVVLAKLARVFQGEGVVKKIYEAPKLDYRQTDNINYFFNFIKEEGLPDCFIFETTDLYNKKNIPKVIYCIHALSHLLARRGLAERIGDLVGQLKFSDDQLQKAEKGLKDANVPMPNFGNVGKELAKEMNEEPEVEVETEDERRDRLLLECEDSIIGLQSVLRGFLLRKTYVQRRARLKLAEKYVTRFQARSRGNLSRRYLKDQRNRQQSLTPWVVALQARARGLITRRAYRHQRTRLRSHLKSIVKMQAQARGVLQRRKFARLKGALAKSKVSVVKIQAIARARLARKSHKEVQKILERPRTMQGVRALQAQARGVICRRKVDQLRYALVREERHITSLQAHVRGALIRRNMRAQLARLDDVSGIVIRIQAAARCFLARRRLLELIRALRKATSSIVAIQTLARTKMGRKRHQELKIALGEIKVVKAVSSLQSLARAAIVRKKHHEQSKKLEFLQPDVIRFQAVARAALVRLEYFAWRDHLRNSYNEAVYLQSLFRGLLERRKFRAKLQYYKENLDKVVKIQSLYRAKETREQYRQLTLGHNVSVGTIKNFVHLLDDSEADFEDEIEVERLRKRVVQAIRDNQALENDVSELDVKIALVVQNVKSFEELVRMRRRGTDSAAAHATRASVLAAHGDPFSGSSLDHTTKRKLELYQQLFYLLQTHGEYLSKLFSHLAKSNDTETNKKLVERVVLTLFGYGQNRREEYLLLKLLQMSVVNDVMIAPALSSVLLDFPMHLAIAIQYGRPKQVSYVRDTLQPMIVDIVDQDDLDLETDPCIIYRTRINAEEMRTGKKSLKPRDITFHEAVVDPDTRAEFIRHLQLLQALTKDFMNAIAASAKKVPYSLRFIAREALLASKAKFPNEPDDSYIGPLGRLLYYRYINPAIVAPETFDLVSNTISITARKNLNEISKMLVQISTGTVFGEESPCLTPLNSYVSEAIVQMKAWIFEVADVQDAEIQYHANEFLDVSVQPMPIYISPNEVYSMHSLLNQYLDRLSPSREDTLRQILTELGGVPHLGTDELIRARENPVMLELTNRFANVEDPHAEEKALWVQAKRAVLAILRVQPAKDLMECLMQPVSQEHELFWEDIVDRELLHDHVRLRQRRMPSATGPESAYRLDDIRSLTFAEVKARAIEFLLSLEKMGKVSREDGFQGILNAIAGDVRSKHRKRMQRQQELASMSDTLTHLAERKKFYEEQLRSYHDYVEAAMKTMQKGKSKKRFVMPFTKQYFHLRELQRSGKTPQFGSYKYSAQDLYEKGILLSIDQFSPRQFDRIDVVLSSNKAGSFNVEVYNTMLGPTALIAETAIRMEDLLQAQFENRVSLALFDGLAKFNLNLLLYQINKKFYV